jgi:hypothetical protein
MAGEGDAAGAAGQGQPNGSAEPAASPWAGLDPESSGWIQNKQFKDVGSLVKGYRELERFRGVPAERLLTLPDKEDAPEWADIHKRLGRPEKPEGYEIDGITPEIAQMLWEAGTPKGKAQSMAKKLAEIVQAQDAQRSEATQQEVQLAEQSLRREWGGEYEANMRHGKSAVAAIFQPLGWDQGKVGDFIEAMQDSMIKIGHKPGEAYAAVMKTFARMGRAAAPAQFVNGDGADSAGDGFGTTPDSALRQFRALSNDSEFMKKLDAGDAAANAKYERLAKLASPAFKAGGPQF